MKKLIKVKSKFYWYASFFLSMFLLNIDPLDPPDKRNSIGNPYYNSNMNNPHKKD